MITWQLNAPGTGPAACSFAASRRIRPKKPGAYRSNEDSPPGSSHGRPLSPEELVKLSTSSPARLPPTPPPSRDSGYSSPGGPSEVADNTSASSEGSSSSIPSSQLTKAMAGLTSLKSASQKPSFPVALVAALASLPFDSKTKARGCFSSTTKKREGAIHKGAVAAAAAPHVNKQEPPAAGAAAATAQSAGVTQGPPAPQTQPSARLVTPATVKVPPAPPAARIPTPPAPQSTIADSSNSNSSGEPVAAAKGPAKPEDPADKPLESSAAAAAAAPGDRHRKPPPAELPAVLRPDDIARPKAAAAAAAAAIQREAAAAGAVSAAPLDSWGSILSSSDEDAEQQAKQRVIELLTHPLETELLLLEAAEAQQQQQQQRTDPANSGRGGSGGLSVSPEYIDALVKAATEPTMGMPHPDADSSSSTSTISPSPAAATTPAAAPPSAPVKEPECPAAAQTGSVFAGSPAASRIDLPKGRVKIERPTPGPSWPLPRRDDSDTDDSATRQAEARAAARLWHPSEPLPQQQVQQQQQQVQEQQHPGPNSFYSGLSPPLAANGSEEGGESAASSGAVDAGAGSAVGPSDVRRGWLGWISPGPADSRARSTRSFDSDDDQDEF